MSEHEKHSVARRDFLKIGGAATAGVMLGATLPQGATALPPLPKNPNTHAAMPTRNLGKTGYRVGIFSLGGQASVEQPNNHDVAISIVNRAIDLGVNYLDTAAAYGGPERWSQRYIGEVMKTRRKEVFLATKTNDRTRDGSLRLLDESLKLLNTDHLDLWQVHNLSRMEQIEQIFAKGGAMEALHQAREQKMVRNLGLTGHADPEVLMEGIRRFPFDTILLALNAADKHQASFTEKLLPMAVERNMGIIGMKVPARGRILSSANQRGAYYEEGQKAGLLSMKDALYYVLSLPVSTVIVGCDNVEQVTENVELARAFTPLSEAQMSSMAQRVAPIAQQALFFRRWA